MASRSARLCQRCRRIVPAGPCPHCTTASRAQHDATRASTTERGYGHAWRRDVREPYLAEHPLCALCGALAEVPDHYPRTRRELVRQGVPDPDAWHRLRPLCLSCHARHGER